MRRLSQALYFIHLITCVFCYHAYAQNRYVVVDMETGVPQRDVRVRWDNNHVTHTIWDGSFNVDSVRDSIEIMKYGYMTRIMASEQLTDTIGIIPTFNKLTEVVVWGKYKPGWTLKPLTKEEIAAMTSSAGIGISVDVMGGIEKLLNRKRRKREKKIRKELAKY